MVSEDKLIKEGIRYTDKLFTQLKKRVTYDLEHSKSLEEFLERTKDFTIQNPLVTTGYQATMTRLVTQAVYNSRFARASQRELVRTAIDNQVGNLIVNVGEDLKNNIREIVKKGYDEGLHSREISKNIASEIDTINNTRARVIARTEVKRAETIANYIVNNERGATHFEVYCRPDCCPICEEDYSDTVFTIDQTEMLPPRHPNCRCGVRYYNRSEEADDIRSQIHIL